MPACASASSPMTAGRGRHHGFSAEPCTDRLRVLPVYYELRTVLWIPRRHAQGGRVREDGSRRRGCHEAVYPVGRGGLRF
eukprot:6710209-Prymnesium_polylepis.2